MSRLCQGGALAILLSFPLGVWGHGFFRPHTTVAYYYPAPMSYVPVLPYDPYPMCIPPPLAVYPSPSQPFLPGPAYAPPTAAPPSAGPSTPEPPLATPPGPAKPPARPSSSSPGFGESTSFYDAYSVTSQKIAIPAGERCTVDFWNLTDRDLVMRIDGGAPQVLPRGKSLPFALDRQFTWQVEGRPAQNSRVDRDESRMQIVIRR